MPAIESAPSMPSVLEVDVPTPPSSAGAAQVSQSWLPKAGSTLQPDPMYRQKRLALEDDAPENTTTTSRHRERRVRRGAAELPA